MFETGLNWIYKSDKPQQQVGPSEFLSKFHFSFREQILQLCQAGRKMASEDFVVEICGENKFPGGSNLWTVFSENDIE